MKHYHLPEIVKFVDHLHHSKTSCSLANKKKREDKVWKIALVNLDSRPVFQYTLQMFTGVYRVSAGKPKCGNFKFMGIACIPTIPAIFREDNCPVLRRQFSSAHFF